MLKAIVRFIKILNSNSHPGEVAHGICLGMVLGFLPKNNIFWYILATFFLFIRVNRGCLAVFTFIFALLAPTFDSLFDKLGYDILTLESLAPLFTFLLDIPFLAFTKFNNSIVMGAFLSSIIIYFPLYFIVRLLIREWRHLAAPAIRKTKVINFLTKMPLIKKINELGDF